MPDKLTIEQRHYNMSRIRSKDTKPEILVRKFLWNHGLRYRLNHPRLPGKPDVVLRKYRTCIFVNGCFWHGHGIDADEIKNEEIFYRHVEPYECSADADRIVKNRVEETFHVKNSECCKIPKTNRAYWVTKIWRNQERDHVVQQKLAAMGWHSITIWECELKPGQREATLHSLLYTLNTIFLQDRRRVRKYTLPEETSLQVAEDCE